MNHPPTLRKPGEGRTIAVVGGVEIKVPGH